MPAGAALMVAVAVSVVAVVMIPALQRQLTYFPMTAPAEELVPIAQRFGLEPWTIDDEIVAWRSAAGPHTQRRLLIFHGNGGFALHRAYFLPLPPRVSQWQVILAEYPGYGTRTSRQPSEAMFRRTAETILEAMLHENELPIYLVGESLGTGVAAWLAAGHPDRIAGMLFVTPMTRLADVASYHYPWLPVGRFLTDRYDCVEALERYAGPVAFVVAENDEIIPPKLGRSVYDSYRGPKRLWIQAGAGHNTIDYDPGWWAPVFEFLLGHEEHGPDADT